MQYDCHDLVRSEFPNLYREGLKGTAEKLGSLGAEILAPVILGSILLVRPYRLFQEVIVDEMVKLYERVERRYRPESYRQRADIAEEENQALRERIAELESREEIQALRDRIDELERQIREDGPQRRRRRRNNLPRE